MLPNLDQLRISGARDSIGARFYPLITEVKYSLDEVLGDAVDWKIRVSGDDTNTTDVTNMISLVQQALMEFAVYRKWVIRIGSPPLAGQYIPDTEMIEMLTALSRMLDAIEFGHPVTTLEDPVRANSNYNSILSRYNDEVHQFQVYTARAAGGEYLAERLPNHGAFGARADSGGRPRQFGDWLKASKHLDDDVSDRWMKDAFKQPASRPTVNSATLNREQSLSYTKGSCYTGSSVSAARDFTIEHVIPQNWTLLTARVSELENASRDARLISVSSKSDNSARGTKPLSFAIHGTRLQRPDGDEYQHEEYVAKFLYNPAGFTNPRKAEASRVVSYGFVTYPLLSDVPHYANSIPGGQVGSWLTAQQLPQIVKLQEDYPPNRAEKLFDWVRWYLFGGCNPFIHDTSLLKNGTEVYGLLKKRLDGSDALSQILMLHITGQFKFREESSLHDAPPGTKRKLK